MNCLIHMCLTKEIREQWDDEFHDFEVIEETDANECIVYFGVKVGAPY